MQDVAKAKYWVHSRLLLDFLFVESATKIELWADKRDAVLVGVEALEFFTGAR